MQLLGGCPAEFCEEAVCFARIFRWSKGEAALVYKVVHVLPLQCPTEISQDKMMILVVVLIPDQKVMVQT